MTTDGRTSGTTNDRTSGTTWAELFLSLLYAGTVLLLLAWLARWELGQPPESLKGLEKIVGQGWSWAISAACSALVSLIFYRRISNLVLVWTLVLIVSLGVAAYFLRAPRFLAPEHWKTTEANGMFGNDWQVKFDGSSFPCAAAPGFNGGSCTAYGWGDIRAVDRFYSPDNNPCTFIGKVSGDTVIGHYYCRIGGPYNWTAKINP
jgi:hypothetical protein